MTTTKNLAILALLLALPACEAPEQYPKPTLTIQQPLIATLGTQQNTFHNTALPIIYVAWQVTLPPNPHAPSASSTYLAQYRVHGSNLTKLTFTITNSTNFFATPSPGHFERGYMLTVTGVTATGVTTTVASLAAFPGDQVLFQWFGNVFQPFAFLYTNNASGKDVGGAGDVHANWSPDTTLNSYDSPFLSLGLNTADTLSLPPTHHNCVGDMPASNLAGNVTEEKFLTDLVVSDGTHTFPLFGAPITNNNPKIMPLNCNLAMQEQFDANNNPVSRITNYGF